MDYLRSLFFEELAQEQNLYVSEGRLFIRDQHWAPEEVLQSMLAESELKSVFLDWVQERKEGLVSQADEILANFDQKDRFRRLTESHKRGTVTPFIGAGLSIPSGYPGWTSFLRQQRKQTGVTEAQLEAAIISGDYEGAAQLLADSLRAGFNEAVESAYGSEREVAGPVQFVPYVFDTGVITTNFDNVIERSFDSAQRRFDVTINGSQAEELPKYIGEGKKVLLKLHGNSTSPKGRILTAAEYQHHYGSEDGLKRAIETICHRTLLFLGCSLTVDRTLGVMKAYVADKGHDSLPRHYAFLEEPPTEEEKLVRRDQLVDCNIYPIWYPLGEHSQSIEALLAKLAEGNR